jgi:2-dehydropantoate 2-reductase
MERLNILVFGAGAIGTYVGGSLGLAGNNVTFLEQPKAVDELKERGLHLELPKPGSKKQAQEFSSHTLPPASFTCVSSLKEALGQTQFDVAIFALKSFDTGTALQSMEPFARQLPPLLCLSNGVDNEPNLAAVLGRDKVIAGTVTSSVGRRGVGDILLERMRGVGVADGHPLSLMIAEALNAAGLNARIYPSPSAMKWSKMLTNLPANATAAILDMTAAEVFAHPELFQLEMCMLREALAVMKAIGVRVVNLPGVPVKALALGTKLPEWAAHPLMKKAVGGGRGGKMPSFHIDLHSGRGRSEVEWLNGAVVRFGQEHGIPAPVNKVLTDTLLALTRGEIPLSRFSHQPERLLEIKGRC